jgi:hypothetical protein
LLEPDPHSKCGSGSKRAKMTHKNIIQYINLMFFEVLDVLFCGLKASLVSWLSFMEA